MRAKRRDLLLGVGLTVFLLAVVWSAVFVTSQAVNQLLRQDAEAEGEAWARYLAANVKDLHLIVSGESPSADSMHFFEQAQKVGDVFLYKIYDAKGGLRLSSDKLEEVGKAGGVHPRPQSGSGGSRCSRARPRSRPRKASRPIARISTPKPMCRSSWAARSSALSRPTSISRRSAPLSTPGSRASRSRLPLIIAIAFGLPALGFYWRTRQKRQADSRAEFLAHHDALTELLNRARFMRDLNEAIVLGCPVAVHAIDIDRFKDINDTLGQVTGDAILKEVARRLQTLSEKQDLLARLGGDDFALAQIVRSPGSGHADGAPHHRRARRNLSSERKGRRNLRHRRQRRRACAWRRRGESPEERRDRSLSLQERGAGLAQPVPSGDGRRAAGAARA